MARIPKQASNGTLMRHGAVWLTMLGLAVSGITWTVSLANKVENQQEQIAALQTTVAARTQVLNLVEVMQKDIARMEPALQATVAARSQVLNIVESLQRDIARLERAHERLHEDVDKWVEAGDVYKELMARMGEHLRTLDARVVQLERVFGFGWRSERGLETEPSAR